MLNLQSVTTCTNRDSCRSRSLASNFCTGHGCLLSILQTQGCLLGNPQLWSQAFIANILLRTDSCFAALAGLNFECLTFKWALCTASVNKSSACVPLFPEKFLWARQQISACSSYTLGHLTDTACFFSTSLHRPLTHFID